MPERSKVLTKDQLKALIKAGIARKQPPALLFQALQDSGYTMQGGYSIPQLGAASQGGRNPTSMVEAGKWFGEALPGLVAGTVAGPAGAQGARLGVNLLGKQITARIPATIGGAMAGGTAGELGREGLSISTGQGMPPPSPAAEMVQNVAPMPQQLAEGVAQGGLQSVGDLAAAPLRWAGKGFARLTLGPANMKHDAAEVAMREGVPLSSRGLKKIQKTVADLGDKIRSHVGGRAIKVNVWNDLADPVQQELRQKAMMDDNPEIALAAVENKMAQWLHDPENGAVFLGWQRGPGGKRIPRINPTATIDAQRTYRIKQSTGNKVAKRWERDAWGTMDPITAAKSRWESEFNEAMSNRARAIVHEAVPDIVALDKRASELLDLSDEIGRAIKPGFTSQLLNMGLQHGPGVAMGAGALYSHGGSPFEKFIATGGALAAGEALSNPEIMRMLTGAVRQTPRAVNAYSSGAR